MTVPRTPALDRICADLRAVAEISRRERIRNAADAYKRSVNLPRILPEFADRPGHPFCRLAAEYDYLTVTDAPSFTVKVMRACVRRLRVLCAIRKSRPVEREIDLLRIVLEAERRTLARQTGRRRAA